MHRKIQLPFYLFLFFALIMISCQREERSQLNFILNNSTEPESLDPHLIQGIPENRIFMALFEGLVSSDPATSRAVPALAKSWTISDDGLSYTFQLRDAVWSDGVRITAQTVVDSWLRVMSQETASPYAWLPASLIKNGNAFLAGEVGPEEVGLQAVNDNTFKFTTDGPRPYVIDSLSHYSFAVVPTHVIEELGESWTLPENIVSNGPFVLQEWVVQDKIIVRKNLQYWDVKNVALETVSFLPIEDETTAMNLYKQGEIDWQPYLPLNQLDEISLRDDFQRSAKLGSYYVSFNNQKAPFDNSLVRKAFAMSIDRERLVEFVTKAGEIPASGLVPPIDGYQQPDNLAFDPVKAKELLSEAGYANVEDLPVLEYIYYTSDSQRIIAEYLQQEWEKNLGVRVLLVNKEWKSYLDEINQKNYLMIRGGWSGDYLDPSTFLDLFTSANNFNTANYYNNFYDDLVLKASTERDFDTRYALFSQADSLLVDDAILAPLFYYSATQLIDTEKWAGWQTNIQDIHPYKSISLKE